LIHFCSAHYTLRHWSKTHKTAQCRRSGPSLYINCALSSTTPQKQLNISNTKSSQVTNHQQCILHWAKSNSTVKNRNFSWLWCSWSSSGVLSRLVWLYVFFFSFWSFCLLIWSYRVSFCTQEGTLPYGS
jgi:hypothetical protein